MTKPLVSIIITYYNLYDFVAETIDSVKNQTYKNLELILVDDCSPGPNVKELVQNLFPSIIYIRNETNQGLGNSRNIGIESSQGQYILPLDADDLIAPNYLEKTIPFLENGVYDGIYTDVRVFGSQNFIHTPSNNLMDALIGIGGTNNFLFTRKMFDTIGGYKNVSCEDREFWLNATSFNFQFFHIAEPLFSYRKRSGSMSQDKDPRHMLKSLLPHHKSLYEKYIESILLAQDDRYWKSQDMYHHLLAEFHKLLESHETLEKSRAELESFVLSMDEKKQKPVSKRRWLLRK
jgi:glycosyltransferase involved in cell wall biosynthesis